MKFLDKFASKVHPFVVWWLAAETVLLLVAPLTYSRDDFVCGSLFWGGLVLLLWCLRGKSPVHSVTMETFGKRERWITLVVMLLLVWGCTSPMSINPIHNGVEHAHRNQYETMTEAILQGRISMDIWVDPKLMTMPNPYDYAARQELGVWYILDHAYYDGHYYMYFGIVPVFLAFLPYRIITGVALTTYKATQLFVGFSIVGIFLLLFLLGRTFLKKMTFGMYLTLATAFSSMSIWYSIHSPALYCTAITSAICMEVWSLYFFVRAVWYVKNQNWQIVNAFFGALFGALAFGCRPPVALANLLVIPMLWEYLKKNKLSWPLAGKLALAASPYVVIGALLMIYNYVRFDSPFEFGQAYQLTIADQSNYGDALKNVKLTQLLNSMVENFISYNRMTETFPYVRWSGALVNFPILTLCCGLLFAPVRQKMQQSGAAKLTWTVVLTVLAITALDVLWAPFLQERYRMDIYFLMGILCFLVLGFWHESLEGAAQKKFCVRITYFGFLTILMCGMMTMVPADYNTTHYLPEILPAIESILRFGFPAA